MSTTIKLRSTLAGAHVDTTIFMGSTGGTLACLGTITNDVDGWTVFGTTLSLGAERWGGDDRVLVEFEDDEALIAVLAALREKDNLGGGPY